MKELYVKHHKAECTGLELQLCLLVSEHPEGPFEFVYDPIRGFDYRWGTDYLLRVEELDVSGPPQDASALVRELAEIVEETPRGGVTFEMTLTGGTDRIVEVEDGTFSFYEERRFKVEAPEVEAVRSALERPVRFAFVFEHPDDPTDPLLMRQWRELPK